MTDQDANIARIEGIYKAFGAGDIESVFAAMAPDFSFDNAGPQDLEYFHPRRSRDGFAEVVAMLGRDWEFSKFEPVQYFAAGNRVAVEINVSATIRSTGRSYSTVMVEIWTIGADGLATHMQLVQDSAAVAAALRADPAA